MDGRLGQRRQRHTADGFTPRPHYSRGKRPWCPLNGRLSGPERGSGHTSSKEALFLVSGTWMEHFYAFPFLFFFRFVSNIGDTYGSALLLHMLTSTVTLTLLAYQATKVRSSPCLLWFLLRTMIPLHIIRFPGLNNTLLLYKYTEKLWRRTRIMRWTRHAECM